jgi:hypothetical protein
MTAQAVHGKVCATATAAFFSLPRPNRRARRRNLAPGRLRVRAAVHAVSTSAARQVPVALTGGGVLALAGRFVVTGRQPAPGGQAGAGGEPGHVAASLGHDHLGGALPDPGDRHQPGDDRRERLGRCGD